MTPEKWEAYGLTGLYQSIKEKGLHYEVEFLFDCGYQLVGALAGRFVWVYKSESSLNPLKKAFIRANSYIFTQSNLTMTLYRVANAINDNREIRYLFVTIAQWWSLNELQIKNPKELDLQKYGRTAMEEFVSIPRQDPPLFLHHPPWTTASRSFDNARCFGMISDRSLISENGTSFQWSATENRKLKLEEQMYVYDLCLGSEDFFLWKLRMVESLLQRIESIRFLLIQLLRRQLSVSAFRSLL